MPSSSELGAKAGFISGLIPGCVLAVTAIASLVAFKGEVLKVLTRALEGYRPLPVSVETLYWIALILGPLIVLIASAVLGLLFGAAYGWVYERIHPEDASLAALLLGSVKHYSRRSLIITL